MLRRHLDRDVSQRVAARDLYLMGGPSRNDEEISRPNRLRVSAVDRSATMFARRRHLTSRHATPEQDSRFPRLKDHHVGPSVMHLGDAVRGSPQLDGLKGGVAAEHVACSRRSRERVPDVRQCSRRVILDARRGGRRLTRRGCVCCRRIHRRHSCRGRDRGSRCGVLRRPATRCCVARDRAQREDHPRQTWDESVPMKAAKEPHRWWRVVEHGLDRGLSAPPPPPCGSLPSPRSPSARLHAALPRSP